MTHPWAGAKAPLSPQPVDTRTQLLVEKYIGVADVGRTECMRMTEIKPSASDAPDEQQAAVQLHKACMRIGTNHRLDPAYLHYIGKPFDSVRKTSNKLLQRPVVMQ